MRTASGSTATKVFGVHGGTIGRGPDNAWILPDPDRYLSGKHVRIDFRAGNYVLVDTSSNGTYVNCAQVPLGKYHDYMLKDGDYVRMGEYEMLGQHRQEQRFPDRGRRHGGISTGNPPPPRPSKPRRTIWAPIWI